MKGMGRIFRRSKIWWIAYCFRGKELRESSGSEREADAKKLLKQRLGEIGRGKLIGPAEARLTFEELAEDFVRDYEINSKRSLSSAKLSVTHLRKFFGLDKALEITTDRVRAYISFRQSSTNRRGQSPKNATINRELSALKRMFTLAKQASKISTDIHIPMLEENNARQGFVDHGAFVKVSEKLPDYLRDPIIFLYRSGWRVSEMRALAWRDVDLHGRVVRLRPEHSKNKKGRVLPLSGDLLTVFQRAKGTQRLDCPFVFHRAGRRIGDFKKAWKSACKDAGLSGTLVHDLRRTAVRNLVRAEVPDVVAMSFTGHKTRSIFDRYNIVSEKDLAQAADQLESYLRAQPATAAVQPIREAV